MREHGDEIVAELEQHRAQTGSYPEQLTELPGYMSLRPSMRERFFYSASERGYELSFHYYGPCINVCSYRTGLELVLDESPAWSCSGRC
jgi:hypothetical protein